jgi:hypothetical protein
VRVRACVRVQMIDDLDRDGDGVLNVHEWSAQPLRMSDLLRGLQEACAQREFRHWTGGEPVLTHPQVVRMLTAALKERMRPPECADDWLNIYNCVLNAIWQEGWECMQRMDDDRDGLVQLSEFERHPKELPEALPRMIDLCYQQLYDHWWALMDINKEQHTVHNPVRPTPLHTARRFLATLAPSPRFPLFFHSLLLC